jgi:hypothetical protein
MALEIDRVIVQASITFVSIFVTIGLLIGATTQEFKLVFVCLGYMLYYSLPFVLAAFWSTVSIISHDKNRREAQIVSYLAVTFFLTGLTMLIYLASAAAQTALLPTRFVFLMPYQSLSFLQFFVFFVFLVIPMVTTFLLSKRKPTKKLRAILLAIFLMISISGVYVMTIYGVNQRSYLAKTDSVFLAGEPDFGLKSVDITLRIADQVVVEIRSSDDHYFNYAFLNEKNYELYANSTTRVDASTIRSDFGSDLSFQQVIEASGKYYLAMKSEYFIGTNVTYSIQVYETENSVLTNSFLTVVLSASIVFGMLTSSQDTRIYDRIVC